MKFKTWWLIVVVVIVISIAGAAYAGATFGTVTGPVNLNPGYRFTVEILSISNPDKAVCLHSTVNGAAIGSTNACTGSGTGIWTCDIATNQPDSTVDWYVATYAQACTTEKTRGPNGSFTTGPTAVTLARLDAGLQHEPIWPWPALLAVVILLLGAIRYRSRKA